MDNEDEGARLTQREESRELIAKHRATVEPKGCPTPGSCSAVEELADLKQRILPQFAGRAQRAEHERDGMLEQLIAARSATAATDAEVDEFVRVARTFSDEHYQNSLVAELRRVYHAQEETAQGHARYEYIRTLNPWKFAALCNQTLMGVHQFDDLVDRYRAKGKTVECGYDRTASLNAGKYVCTCGGACSHYDAQQPSHTTREKP